MVDCIMCARNLRVRILGNHLLNQHKVGQDQVGLLATMHLDKKCKKVAKKLMVTEEKIKVKMCHKKPMKRASLKKLFESSISRQTFNMDVFSKLLMDVSREYHTSNINREIEETLNDASVDNGDYKGDLKFRINVSSQKIEKSTSNNTSSLLGELSTTEKKLSTSTLSESVFQPNHNSTLLDEGMETNISKLKSSKAAKVNPSIPRQKKKAVSRKNKKYN